MATQSKKEIQGELITRSCFAYWRLQNNPEYVAFYNEAATDPQAAFDRMITIPAVFDGEELLWAERERPWIFSNAAKFGLARKSWYVPTSERNSVDPYPLINPFQNIDWKGGVNLNNPTVKKIYEELWENAGGFGIREIKNEPLLGRPDDCFLGPILVDVRYDKKEIFHILSEKIDLHRKQTGIFPIGRQVFKNFPLYAQTWDLRKSHGHARRKTFKEISLIMKTKESTAKSRFYKAYQLIFDQPYRHAELKRSIPKVTLKRHCGICNERADCSSLCPDVLQYIKQDHINRKEKQTPKYDLILRTRSGISGRRMTRAKPEW